MQNIETSLNLVIRISCTMTRRWTAVTFRLKRISNDITLDDWTSQRQVSGCIKNI
jgi:hypothetical protein